VKRSTQGTPLSQFEKNIFILKLRRFLTNRRVLANKKTGHLHVNISEKRWWRKNQSSKIKDIHYWWLFSVEVNRIIVCDGQNTRIQ